MSDLRFALTRALNGELDDALGRITHCLAQLTDEQVWWRPRPDRNAIGNLVLHLTGNVQQMIVANLRREPDTRDRPAEFAERGPIPGDELLGKLITTVKRARDAIAEASDDVLSEVRRVNNFELTGLQAVVRSVAHFRGHTQEIIHQTRTILGDQYKFAGPRAC